MSDSLPPSSPDNAPDDAPQPADAPASMPAQSVPEPPVAPEAASTIVNTGDEEIEVPHDPEALAGDRAGFKFLAIGFIIFLTLIAICAGIVALVMKNMGI